MKIPIDLYQNNCQITYVMSNFKWYIFNCPQMVHFQVPIDIHFQIPLILRFIKVYNGKHQIRGTEEQERLYNSRMF